MVFDRHPLETFLQQRIFLANDDWSSTRVLVFHVDLVFGLEVTDGQRTNLEDLAQA